MARRKSPKPGAEVIRFKQKPQKPERPGGAAPPAELAGDEIALAEWSRVTPLLQQRGIEPDIYRANIIMLAQQWSIYCGARDTVRREGLVLTSPDGDLTPNPLIEVEHAALTTCLQLWRDLGLTPAGRARLDDDRLT